MAQVHAYFGVSEKGEKSVTIQDLFSFQNATRYQVAQDQVPPSQRVIVSGESISTSIDELEKSGPFDGLCFCSWGMPRADKPNFAIFPPAGMVAHFKMFRKDHHLGLEFVDYVGEPDTSWIASR